MRRVANRISEWAMSLDFERVPFSTRFPTLEGILLSWLSPSDNRGISWPSGESVFSW